MNPIQEQFNTRGDQLFDMKGLLKNVRSHGFDSPRGHIPRFFFSRDICIAEVDLSCLRFNCNTLVGKLFLFETLLTIFVCLVF